jgi:formylglycine-generating enzyme required for sulfatase activity
MTFLGTVAGEIRDDNLLKMRLVWCPPGSFGMGTPGDEDDEAPVNVTLTSGFWLAQYVVTQAEWRSLMTTTPWHGPDNIVEGDRYPATFVSYYDAVLFCEKLTQIERSGNRISGDVRYTLPTEAQWEYACRAGTTSLFSFGAESQASHFGWFQFNTLRIDEDFAHQVGLKQPNAWGFYDMHGNVFEWCRDYCGDRLPGGNDPEDRVDNGFRSIRGGNWRIYPVESSGRGSARSEDRHEFIGFRVSLERNSD